MPKLRKKDSMDEEETLPKMMGADRLVRLFKKASAGTSKIEPFLNGFMEDFPKLKQLMCNPTTEDDMLLSGEVNPQHFKTLEEIYNLLNEDNMDIFKTFFRLTSEDIKKYLIPADNHYLNFMSFSEIVKNYIKHKISNFSFRNYSIKYGAILNDVLNTVSHHKLSNHLAHECHRLGYVVLNRIAYNYKAMAGAR